MVIAQANIIQLNHFLLPVPLIILHIPLVILSPSLSVILSVAKNLTPLRTGSAKNLKTLPLRFTQGQGDRQTTQKKASPFLLRNR